MPHPADVPVRLQPALFLDRDGVINEEVGYLHRWEDVRFVDGIVSLIQQANQLGFFTCVVTNQAGIGRGLYSQADFDRLMDRMQTELLSQGARLDAVYSSPYHPIHGLGEYQRETECRKPRPGMMLSAAADHHLDLAHSLMVGDRCSDMQAAVAAGIPHRLLFRSHDDMPCPEDIAYTVITHIYQIRQELQRLAMALERLNIM